MSGEVVGQSRTWPLFIAINNYSKRMDDELDFQSGDKIQVLTDDEEYNDGWYFGKNLRTQEEGLYPVVFTQEIKMERKYPMTRTKSAKRVNSSTNLNEPLDNLQESYHNTSGSSINLTHQTIGTTTSSLNLAAGDKAEGQQLREMPAKKIAEWTPEDVSVYFAKLGFDKETSEQFQCHKISGQILLELEMVHLKELDITSFGTRFEIFKEIENLRKTDQNTMSNRSIDNLMPPLNVESPSLPQWDNNAKEVSKSLEDLPLSKSSSYKRQVSSSSGRSLASKQQPISVSISSASPLKSNENGEMSRPIAQVISSESSFSSPRKAPKPPSYPSPVQPPRSPMALDSQTSNAKKNIAPPIISNQDRSDSVESFAELIEELDLGEKRNFASKSTSALDDYVSSQKSASSSIYGENTLDNIKVGNTLSNINDKPTSRHSSFKLSPTKQHFTENAANGSSPLRKTPMRNGTSPLYKTYSSPLSNRKPKSNRVKLDAKGDIKFRSTSARDPKPKPEFDEDVKKRSVSEAVKGKGMKKITSKNMAKKQTTAFTEGLRSITVQEAMKDADCSGWMSKKGSSSVGVWKTRYFTLHGTRLSYFASTTDTKERGLIDITGHRVVPARDDDKLVSLYAASTGRGRYCFKMIPPQPGSKKGLTFTQPKIHYFAVDTKEEMRTWMTTLLKTSIDIDTSVPVVSSNSTPTVSLSKAQELLLEAREANRLRERQEELEGIDESRLLWEQQTKQPQEFQDNKSRSLESSKSNVEDETVLSSSTKNLTSTTISSNGFSSPYLLASGLSTPNIITSNCQRSKEKDLSSNTSQEDYFNLPTSKYTSDPKL